MKATILNLLIIFSLTLLIIPAKIGNDIVNTPKQDIEQFLSKKVINLETTERIYTLRITLENFECQKAGDRDDKDDYIFNQWVTYSKKGGGRVPSTDVFMNVNSSRAIKPSIFRRNYIKTGRDKIFKGDPLHQFWVKEGTKKTIGNYIVFEINHTLLNDKYSKFIINNHVYEKSRGDSRSNYMASSNAKVNVDIRRVVKDLINIKRVTPGKWTYYDRMKLRKYSKNSTDLYGYINFRSDGRNARAKMRFKLIK